MASTCFGLRPSSDSLQLSLAKVILRYSVRLLFGGVAACPSVTCVLCAVLCTTHSTHAATPPNNNLTECLNINITLARLNCKLPDDQRRSKLVGAI